MNRKYNAIVFLVVLSSVYFFGNNCSNSAEITVNGAYHFIDNRAANSVHINSGLFQYFGAVSVLPHIGEGDSDTKGVASQGDQSYSLFYIPFDILPNFTTRSIFYNDSTSLNGQWKLEFHNGEDSIVTHTPDIENARMLPFVNSVSISGNGSSPTFKWTIPGEVTPDAVRIQIFDTTDILQVGQRLSVANSIYELYLDGAATNFTVNSDLGLLQNHNYSIEIGLLDTRDNTADGGFFNILSRSRSFFDFTLLPDNSPPNVVLPTLISDEIPYYSFNTAVIDGETIFIDPTVAVGFDYKIGDENDPKFSSFLLPTGIGDNFFELWLWDEENSEYYNSEIDIYGGVKYDFEDIVGGSVSKFRILGIELEAELDPNNTTAFITGLEFDGDGRFTGTMTPLTITTPNPVPVPSTMILFGSGIIGLAAVGKRKRN